MPPKSQPKKNVKIKGHIAGAGIVRRQKVTDTLKTNYMPYAMSVIISRAIPEIDGFKPSHRKILYTMYKMGLLKGARTKSANIVGEVMKLNPHGDQAIYETMVRLSKGNEALLHPFVDSKGNFGKAYSRDMDCAASRYTEAKLAPLCETLFNEIDMDTVDFVSNYDNRTTEPTLLPVTFPAVLVNANMGIAVGMASSICPFNLGEVCETAIALIRDPAHKIEESLKAPDFPGGGLVIYRAEEISKIYGSGRGSVRVRCRWKYDKGGNCIDITEIPPSTTVEAIIEKVVELAKQGKIREILDIRDESDLSGLKLTVDLKRGADPDKLMQRLYRMTPMEDAFSCNFNILVNGSPRVMGVREIITEWLAFRNNCVRRRLNFQLSKKREKLHLLQGLKKILLDIDKAVRVIRETEEESEVVPNLMIGFGIDAIQAEYVAEIKLRHLNREYILRRTEEIAELEGGIAELEGILDSEKKIQSLIIKELRDVSRKYGQERKSLIIYPGETEEEDAPEEVPDYPVNIFLTREGYFKKITPLSLRMGGEQKLKESDGIIYRTETQNSAELLFFTNKCQVYKSRASEFDDTKASLLGDYVPAKLGMEDGETIIKLICTQDYGGNLLIFFENGKASKVPLMLYQTKTKRRKLLNAFSDKSPAVFIGHIQQDCEFMLTSSEGRILLISSAMLPEKLTRDNQGVQAMTLRTGRVLRKAEPFLESMLAKPHRFRVKVLPGSGSLPKEEDYGEQLSLS
ncbi:MAG: topoisomerase IV [Oscillospiraceae bacterium]|jgi:DNA gyrase subunit A|nr:topoisomerase IV [Oscillospiraceae bacterium]